MAEQAQNQNAIAITQSKEDVKELYFDGILRAHLVGGNVKLDMLTLDPNADGQATGRVRARVVMSLQAFLASKETIDNMVQQLVDKNIISKQ